MTTPPRSGDSNPADAPASTPPLVTWCTWRGTAGPPPVLGRTAEDADRRLLNHLAHFYGKEAEQPCENPRVRARQEAARFKNLGVANFSAPDEMAAFHLWVEASSLSAEEALLRWRAVFPCIEAADPLQALVGAMDRAARACEEAETKRLSRAAQVRISVLGRFIDKLPRMSEARVEALREEFDAPTR